MHYIRMTQRLDARIKQHLPKKIQNSDVLTNKNEFSIAEHLINNCNCAANFRVDSFSILSRSHSNYHLKILKGIYILSMKSSL